VSNSNISTRLLVLFILLSVGPYSYELGAQTLETEVRSAYSAYEENIETITVAGENQVSNGLIDAPVKVEVLGSEYLKDQQYQDLSQAISDLPGVSTTQTERRAGATSALIQGFGENSVLVMIDGTPVSQNSSFGFDLGQIDSSDIEKIEVIKGGASALYGSQAIGGVINIVTKKALKKPTLFFEGSEGQLSQGEKGKRQNLKGVYQGRIGKLGTKIALSFREVEEFDLNPSTIYQDGTAQRRLQGSVALDYKWRNFNFFTRGLFLDGKTSSKVSRPFSSSTFGPSINTTDGQSQNIKLGVEGRVGPGTLWGVLNWEKNDDLLGLNDRPETPFVETLKETNSDGRRFDLQYKDVSLGSHKLTTGILVRENTVNQETTSQAVEQIVVKTQDISNKKVSSYEAFLQDNFWLGSFEVSPGARYQYDRDFGSYVAPKINISHFADFSKLGLKSWFSLGTGYRAPSVKERFFTLDHSSVANYIVIGNDNLSPEKSVSLQVGEELTFGKGNSLYGNLFLNRITNLIETVETQTDGSGRVFSYENFDEVTSRGFELGIKSLFGHRTALLLNGSYTETVNEKTNLLLANRPLWNGLLVLTHTLSDNLKVIAQGRYTGAKFTDPLEEETNPAFFTTNLKTHYRYNNSLSIFGSINNVFDKTRIAGEDLVSPNIDDRPSRGREIFLGLRVTML